MILPFVFDAAPNRVAPWLYEFLQFIKMQSREPFGAMIVQEEYIRPLHEWRAMGRKEMDEPVASHKIAQQEMERVHFYALPKSLFALLREQTGSLSNASACLSVNRYEPLENWLYETFRKIEADSKEKIEALIMFRQYRSIDFAAQKCGIKIFYYDAGAFRPPIYRDTVYLDTHGHCTHCGIERRYMEFCGQIQKIPQDMLLSNKEILTLMLEPAYKHKIQLLDQPTVFTCGVAQQSDIITLMIPETHTSNTDLAVLAREHFPIPQILVRGVPGKGAAPLEMQLDDSPFAIDFISKCDCIFTRASNMAYEALLMGKQLYCTERGLYQFKGMQSADYPSGRVESDPLFLAFVAFAFYIPREFLYDSEYLSWRLSEPSEAEIYMKNLGYYLHCRGLNKEILKKEKTSRWIDLLWEQGFDSLGQPLREFDSDKMLEALYALSQIRESSPYAELYGNVMKITQQYVILHHLFEAMQNGITSGSYETKGPDPRNSQPMMDEKLYCDDGTGWSESNSLSQPEMFHIGKFAFSYSNLAGRQKGNRLRWDPVSYGGLILNRLQASITDASGREYVFRPEDITVSGRPYENGYAFPDEDPQVYFQMPEGFAPDRFTVSGTAKMSVPVQELSKWIHLEQYLQASPVKAAIKLLLGKHPTRDSLFGRGSKHV